MSNSDQSYLVFHAPLFWDVDDNLNDFSSDLYHFVMGMHLYRRSDKKRYFDFVRDPPNMTRIDLDWKAVLDAKATADAFVLTNQEYYNMHHKNDYKESASFL